MTASSTQSSKDVRQQLVEALTLDLVGPWQGHEFIAEQLPGWVRPSTWYLTGFLIPSGSPPEAQADDDETDDLDEIPEHAGLAEESSEDRKSAKKGHFPSSLGLSFLVAKEAKQVDVLVRWGDYRQVAIDEDDPQGSSADTETSQDGDGAKSPKTVWQRSEHSQQVRIPIGNSLQKVHHSDGLETLFTVSWMN